MCKEGTRKENTTGTGPEAAQSEPEATGKRAMGFDCCGVGTGTAMPGCPCAAAVRRHPLISLLCLALMGLAFLAISTGAILGIITFLRTI